MASEYLIMHYGRLDVPLIRDRTRPPRVVLTLSGGKVVDAFGDDQAMVNQLQSLVSSDKFNEFYGTTNSPLEFFVNGSLSYAALSDVGPLTDDKKSRISDLRTLLSDKPSGQSDASPRKRRGRST